MNRETAFNEIGIKSFCPGRTYQTVTEGIVDMTDSDGVVFYENVRVLNCFSKMLCIAAADNQVIHGRTFQSVYFRIGQIMDVKNKMTVTFV